MLDKNCPDWGLSQLSLRIGLRRSTLWVSKSHSRFRRGKGNERAESMRHSHSSMFALRFKETIMSRKRDRVRVGSGCQCPKCGRAMKRYRHRNPPPPTRHYFEFWDHCSRCRHVQLFEEARRRPDPLLQKVITFAERLTKDLGSPRSGSVAGGAV
jgi:hypothetical protein